MARRLPGALAVSAISGEGLHSIGDGLYVKITDSGTRSWVYRYMRNGQSHKMGLGSCSVVRLEEAREKARDARRAVKSNVDPIAERAEGPAGTMTFKRCAEALIETRQAGWRNGSKSAAQWASSFAAVYRRIGNLPVDAIKVGHIVDVLRPVWLKTPESAMRLRNRLEIVFDYAIARQLREAENPARTKILRHLLPQQRHEPGHFAAMGHREVKAFLKRLAREQDGIAARAVRFTILTAARSGETRGATWAEVDFAGKVWVIPGERMKAGREHRVPLSAAALAVLRPLKALGRPGLIFEGRTAGKPLSDMSLSAVLRRMEIKGATVHGFRSSFRDWAADSGKDRELAEAALAHTVRDATERAYRRSDLFERRRRLMTEWSTYLGVG